jgi:signal transduction histidine kinase
MMRSGPGLVTVGGVYSDHLARRRSQGRLAAAFTDRQWLAAGVLAVSAGLITVTLTTGPHPLGREQPLVVILLVCSPVVALRRWPLPVLAVVAAAAGTFVAASRGSLPLGMMLVLGLGMYFVASKLPRKASIGAALAAAAVLGGPLGYATIAGLDGTLAVKALEGFVPLVAAWFIGDSVAARRRYLAGLAEQAERERAAETERARQQVMEERVRIARELHDVVAHTLAVITVQAGVGRRLMAKRPEEASSALESIETIGRTAQDELRVVLGLLRDEEIGPAALAPAPRLVDLKELAETVRASGTPVNLRTSGTDLQLSPALELSVYRVAQEALTNVVKHAPGARATVDVAVSAGKVRIEVTDDGGAAGRPPAGGWPASPATGHGIVGMQERIGAFGGWLEAAPMAGGGFRVLAEVPAERET